MEHYLEELNQQQREAVSYTNGALMIVAGAGSGKTKVLTTRIAHLMNLGVDSFNILALTFTNKAAAEMKERVEHILGNRDARNLYIGTFHSIFARMLRADATKLGYPSNFTIYDTDDAKSVIKDIVKEMNLDDKHYKPAFIYNRISAAKNSLVGPAAYKADRHIQEEDARTTRPMIGEVYEVYAKKCFKNGAMDFDDLLFKMYELLTTQPEALAKYQRRFKYILIDEYQDTNPSQYEIIKLLGAMHENICVVGDDAQSIYSFRGATIQNILQFREDYEDVKVIKLEQNYRSTQTILNVANKLIGHNKDQIPKELWTSNGLGEKIVLVKTVTENDEGRFVADSIKEQQMRNHYNNRDFAILYRTNAQSRSFEESLRRLNIPYKLIGGTSFYQRKEIKDLLAYLRLVVNGRDEEALKRIINYPARGIGKTTVERIIVRANEVDRTFWEVIEAGGWGARVDDFVMMIRSFRAVMAQKNAYDVAFMVGKHTGLIAELQNDKTVEGLARFENFQELLNSIKEFTETPDEEGELVDKSLGSYLQQVTLLTDVDNDKEQDADAVKLMTVHSAKGLEFPCVFVAGMEENLFPSSMSMYDRESIEEERRLFYVAITRAKARLWITFANSRYRFGTLVQNEPSRFLEEIPASYLDRAFTGIGNNANLQGNLNSIFSEQRGMLKSNAEKVPSLKKLADKIAATPKAAEHTPTANFIADNALEMKVGMRVEHQKFGFGEILSVEGGLQNRMAEIDFGEAGKKKIMLNFAKLRIVRQ
jgi:DNA helicase II / ATP-dependent DNA helicase PcrA